MSSYEIISDRVAQHMARRLKKRRLELEMTLEKLAEQVGVTYQQVQKWERGVNTIYGGRLLAIATALHVPISYFYDELEGVIEYPVWTPNQIDLLRKIEQLSPAQQEALEVIVDAMLR